MNPLARPGRWLVRQAPRSAPLLRLFCCPYAGGAADLFRRWPEFFGPEIEIWAIQLPGRRERLGEPPVAEVMPLVRPLAAEMIEQLDRPFAVFGYSMGALICYDLIR